MIDLILKAKGSIFAIGVAALTGLIRKCKEMHSKLEQSKKEFSALADKMNVLSEKNKILEEEKDESQGQFFDQLKVLKQEFEDEWSLRETEWQDKLKNKEEDAQQRLDEIASWQSELARLRTEAIAIRSAIEKVRSRSTSPGRSETAESNFSVETADTNKENSFTNGAGEKENDNIKYRDPLSNNGRGRSPLRV